MKSDAKQKRNEFISAALIAVLAVLIVFGLTRPYGESYQTEKVLPKIGQAPVYEELYEGQPFECLYFSDRDMRLDGLELLMVHTDEMTSGDPYIHLDVIDLTSSNSEPLWTGDFELSSFSAGEWSSVPVSFEIRNKNGYMFRITAEGCEPFFMKVDGYEPGISLGFDVISDRRVTLANRFPYLIPAVIMIALAAILVLLLGNTKAMKAFNILFLVLLFVCLSIKIYKTAYVDGIYITADSDGYLREAVNLVAGNGFSYEGLAGYKSHFANWPIIYPAMIAGVMLITGVNAYLASKFLAFIILALILIVLYLAFKDRAWIYSLALLNLGFIQIAYHTWSELPFILFLIQFGIALGRIVRVDDTDKTAAGWYIILGCSALATFLTRYFGIYLWFVEGLYCVIVFLKNKKKAVCMAVSMGVSGILALAYLVMNKICNGNPTGVARGTWWDDYKTLTIDLINSLVTEVFYVFSLDVPKVLREAGFVTQLIFVLLIALIVTVLIVILSRGIYRKHRIENRLNILFHPPMVFIVMALFYYVMFIIVRYRSSMDTFYFRFFAPATVLLVMGVIGLILDNCRESSTSGSDNGATKEYDVSHGVVTVVWALLGIAVSVSLMTGLADYTKSICRERGEKTYYEIITEVWDEAYSEIPERSVILWNPMDFRSSWTRPDVYSGELLPDDTWDSLRERYYGSESICMLRKDAETISAEGDYDDSVTDRIDSALEIAGEEQSYIVMK